MVAGQRCSHLRQQSDARHAFGERGASADDVHFLGSGDRRRRGKVLPHFGALDPAAIQASASAQQFSNLGIYINGPNAVLANGAKSGSAGYAAKTPPLGSKENPIYTAPSPGGEKSQEFPGGVGPGGRRSGGGPRTNGFIVAPVPVFPPSPTPTQ